MDLEDLTTAFYNLVAPSLPMEEDVREALIPLVAGEAEQVDDILAQVPAIWPVSHALCFAYLSAAGPALCCLSQEELSLWVHSLLDRYEAAGLQGAMLLLQDAGQQFACHLRQQNGLRLADVRYRLQPYANGLVGREMPLVADVAAGTDGESIFLPAEIGVFSEPADNFLLYKLMVSAQWAFLEAGTFAAPRHVAPRKKGAHPLDGFFSEFTRPATARALFHFYETARVLAFLRHELPGLMREATVILPQLPLPADNSATPNLIERLQRGLLRMQWPEEGRALDGRALGLLRIVTEQASDNEGSIEAVRELMPLLETADDLEKTRSLPFQGTLRLQEIRNVGMKQRADKELRLINAMSHCPPPSRQKERRAGDRAAGGADQAKAKDLHTASGQEGASVLADGMIASIEGEGGLVFSPADHAVLDGGRGDAEPVSYDEWDCLRKAFRKKWCVVKEKELLPVQDAFIDQTLRQYGGQIQRLRHQFERLQNSERFVRRQREGNDIDFDALVQSLADAHAGYPPSDQLFVRLARDQRDIAVFFLVDMSNSTAGWVNASIKEALVLVCEAMEALNDRYGVYGFSGMRRLRCEVFPVKRLDEPYNLKVRQRISAIGPREYTRMAPAIRHLTSLFSQVEARIRLLIVLSDGKPEDYDDYKGHYAIEDTRHALMEAKVKGVHPFCITIDRQAHEYMAHMYGEVNYIFIDKVQQVPVRMPEIYRSLTC